MSIDAVTFASHRWPGLVARGSFKVICEMWIAYRPKKKNVFEESASHVNREMIIYFLLRRITVNYYLQKELSKHIVWAIVSAVHIYSHLNSLHCDSRISIVRWNGWRAAGRQPKKCIIYVVRALQFLRTQFFFPIEKSSASNATPAHMDASEPETVNDR